jgi:hypothetical protein
MTKDTNRTTSMTRTFLVGMDNDDLCFGWTVLETRYLTDHTAEEVVDKPRRQILAKCICDISFSGSKEAT